jgi:hypothetical protein
MLTVRYALTREELREWYKVTWRRKLWRYHLAIVVLLCASFALAGTGGSTVSGLMFGAALSALMIVFMVVWPQLRYRPEERTLTFDADGLAYTRGPQQGRMAWSQIGSVADADGGVIVTGRNQSAFIVPTRAFGGEAEKTEAFAKISGLYRQAS